jgi:hypothetical protein
MAELPVRFQQWKVMVELQLEYITRLGKYKLDVAKSDLVAAVASGQQAVARIKAQVAQQLEGALRRLARFEYQNRTRATRIGKLARDASLVRNGDDLSVSSMGRMWAAYRVFERLSPLDVLLELMKIDVHRSARLAESFVNKREPTKPCSDVPDSVENIHMLTGWIKRRGYLPIRGNHAYRHLVTVFGRLANVASQIIKQLRDAIQEMEDRTYDTWKPVVLAALPDNVDVQKIIQAGLK